MPGAKQPSSSPAAHLSVLGTGKSAISPGFSTGHTAFGAGVAVTLVRASKVGVKDGMAGRGVMVCVTTGVAVSGRYVAVSVASVVEDGRGFPGVVTLARGNVLVPGTHAETDKLKMVSARNRSFRMNMISLL